ncbi:MAG: hypothetical protein COA85_13080 [Robiginitomaculum sp.]|nr:MAG: hypothetical protein COA85_13080 [Robiginitomaculum sp.]
MTADSSENHAAALAREDARSIPLGLSIRHLHLNPTVTDQVEALGCKTLSNIVGVLTNPELSAESRQQLATHSFRLLGCISGHDVDWLSYYDHPGFEPKGLYFHCIEFRDIDAKNPVFAINRDSFGNAGAMLERAGYPTFGLLIDYLRTGLSELPLGFGSKKLREFWSALIDLANAAGEKPETLKEWALRYPLGITAESQTEVGEIKISTKGATAATELSPQIRALDLGVLHLGKKTDTLRAQELMTIGDVVDCPRWKILSLPYMGKTTASRITDGLEALANAQRPDGEVDWETYCGLMQLKLLPAQPLEGSFAQTIALLPLVIEETILSGESGDNRIILENRIMKSPADRLTLEAVGELMPTQITRERVRQKEAMILRRLAASLIHQDYAKAPYHFRPEFTAPWRKAAEQFSSIEGDISLSDLITGLELAWGMPSEAFQDQLPLITAIITGELPTGGDFRKSMPVEANLLSQGAGDALSVSLKLLQLKKAADALAAEGIIEVGDFLDTAAAGNIDVEKGPAKIARQHIGFLAQSVDSEGNVDWLNYAWLAEVPVFPEDDPTSPRHFLEQIIPTAIAVLEARQLSAIAPQTFQLRTAQALQSRPTTEALADRFRTYGPSVKRVETELLKFLNEVFVGQHLSIAKAHVRRAFLDFWSEVDQAFDEVDGDAELVKRVLAGRWGLDISELEPQLPAIVAIMTGYPMGRLGRYTKIQSQTAPTSDTITERRTLEKAQVEESLPQRVVLKGFRRTH